MSTGYLKLLPGGQLMFSNCDAAQPLSFFVKTYAWRPQEDITAYELAVCLPMILRGATAAQYDALPEQAKRHWVGGNSGSEEPS